MKVQELKGDYRIYGNKGNVWSNTAHISNSDMTGRTLCGTPMLSRNWAKIEEVQDVGCKECLRIYNESENK